MRDLYEQTLLYDFYGELLTPHQQEIYEQIVLNNITLSELAAEMGISRQGVHDQFNRCYKTLEGYESRLHLIERFEQARAKVAEIIRLTGYGEAEETNFPCGGTEERSFPAGGENSEKMKRIAELSREILNIL